MVRLIKETTKGEFEILVLTGRIGQDLETIFTVWKNGVR